MKKFALYVLMVVGIAALMMSNANAQPTITGKRNVITTSVPFLSITPDSRSGGLGDAGIALPPDANTPYWNSSKLAFVKHNSEISASYTPWLSNLVPDINLSYLSGYYKIDDLSAAGMSMRYFSLGDIQFTDESGNNLKEFRPTEFAIAGSYGRKLSAQFSIGLSLRYIRSNLAGNTPTGGGTETQPGNAVSGDISAYWTNKDLELFNVPVALSLGANIRNVGSKITYTDESERDFIPMNLGIGSYINFQVDEYNEIALLLDFNKLLVPTPPEYIADSFISGTQNNQQLAIRRGYSPNVSVMKGVTQSFYDAPGGFSEEMKEIKPSIGVEYWYDEQFSLRTGFFYEHEDKGDRQYLTLGAGLRYNVLGVDVAYLVPTQADTDTSPLANTIRISLSLQLDSQQTEGEGNS